MECKSVVCLWHIFSQGAIILISIKKLKKGNSSHPSPFVSHNMKWTSHFHLRNRWLYPCVHHTIYIPEYVMTIIHIICIFYYYDNILYVDVVVVYAVVLNCCCHCCDIISYKYVWKKMRRREKTANTNKCMYMWKGKREGWLRNSSNWMIKTAMQNAQVEV